MTRKILIVTGDAGDSYQTLYARHRFLEAGWEPVVAAPARRRLHLVIHDREPGWDTYVERVGHTIEADMAITAVNARDFALVLIVGGRAPEYLRNDASLVSLVREFASHQRVICAIGHGVQVLAAADLLKGRTVTGHPNVCLDVERDGGTYVQKASVRDGRMVTAQSWESHPELYREIFALLNEPARV